MAEPATSSSRITADASTDEWLRNVAALTVAPQTGPCDHELDSATGTANALAACASSLLQQGVVGAAACATRCAGCAAGDLSCQLVRDLAASLPADVAVPARIDLADYRRALAAAGHAVFTCRRTLHASGICLFGPPDLCGRVLAAAHRLG